MSESIRQCHPGGASTPLSQHARTITIKHPGYSPAEDLLCFPAYDNTPALWGYSHLLVLDACRIIANNRDGFVSTTPHRSDRVPEDEHTLAAGVYYYFLSDDSDPPYPVNACFDTWSFPDTMPAHWRASRAASSTTRPRYGTSESDVSAQVQIAGDTCVISGDSKRHSWEDAQLVPIEQGYWFLGHKMWLHNNKLERRSVDDSANSICLRPDLRSLLDRHAFVFFPSPSERGAQGRFVAYFIQPEHAYAEGFHRVEARIPESVSLEFLYARFALNVIASAKVSRDAVRTVKYGPRYEGELRRLSERRLARQRNAVMPPLPRGQPSEERERLGAVRRQLAMEEVFYNRYPHLRQEVTHSDDPDYQSVAWHPEADRMQKLVKMWFDHNPQIRQTSRPGGDVEDPGSPWV